MLLLLFTNCATLPIANFELLKRGSWCVSTLNLVLVISTYGSGFAVDVPVLVHTNPITYHTKGTI